MVIRIMAVEETTIAAVSKLHVSAAQSGMVETVEACFQEAQQLALWQPVAIELDGQLVGFAMYGLWETEGAAGRVWLDRFLIGQQFQGKGYANLVLPLLFQRISKEYGRKELYLSVYESNPVAIRLYQKFGFSFNGEADINGEKVMVRTTNELKAGASMVEEIQRLITEADRAIKDERFDDLMDFYTEDAVLVVKPGLEAHGKAEIKSAFIKIAAYFKNSVVPSQGRMLMLEAGDTVLVLSQTLLQADKQSDSAYSMDRRATYIYRKINEKWLCAVDNSYGTTLLD